MIKKEKKILFRADASPVLGIGDLSSLINLSEYFIENRWKVYFLIKDTQAGLALTKMKGVENLYTMPAGITVEDEVRKLNSVIEEVGIDLVFFEITERKLTDYKGLSKKIKKACVCFDGHVFEDMDIVIDWDTAAFDFFNPEKYPGTKFLLGPEFVILPINFDRQIIESRKYKQKPETLLLTMGGADELDFTGKILDILIKQGIALKIKAIVGSGYGEIEALKKKAENADVVIEQNVKNMFEQYLSCDVAIGAGGLTASELVATKTPAILIATHKHQQARCEYFNEKGWVNYLGYRDFDEDELVNSVINPPDAPDTNIFNTARILDECNKIF